MTYIKPKDESHNSSEWYTPSVIVEAARQLMEGIGLDPASCEKANETVRAKGFYSKDLNGLLLPWHSTVWLNPPYGKGHSLKAWIEKLVEEYECGNVHQACVILPAHTAQKYFQTLWKLGPVCFLNKRVRFLRPDGSLGDQPMYGHALVWLPINGDWGPEEAARMADVFKDLGTVVLKVGS